MIEEEIRTNTKTEKLTIKIGEDLTEFFNNSDITILALLLEVFNEICYEKVENNLLSFVYSPGYNWDAGLKKYKNGF